jgi:hypothetical protein
MFHGVGFDVPGQSRLEEKFLRERLGNILADHKRIGSIIAERTKLDQKVVETLSPKLKPKTRHLPLALGLFTRSKTFKSPRAAT